MEPFSLMGTKAGAAQICHDETEMEENCKEYFHIK